MAYARSCQAISAKCAVLPLINNFMKVREKSEGKRLGRLGPCLFKPRKEFLLKALRRTATGYTGIKTPILIEEGQQVVAVGDIHADFLVLLGTLYLMGLISLSYDEDRKKWRGGDWIGGNTIFVQCGDLLDRAGRSASVATDNNREELDIVQYMYALNITAQEQGGGVYWVLGNHDIARVFWKQYQGNEIEDVDEQGRRIIRRSPDYRKYIGNQKRGWGGNKKMGKLFQPGGLMAQYMSLYASFTLQVQYYVFMHGGLTVPLAEQIIDELKVSEPQYFYGRVNQNVQNALFYENKPLNKAITKMAWDRTWSKDKALKDGEKWEEHKYAIAVGRGSTKASKYCTRNMHQLFRLTGMDWEKSAFVLGHSIQDEGIPLYCKGRVWRIDLGMSEAFSSGKIPKVIGGIKIFMYPDRPVEVLVVMNYASDGENIDKFILYVKREFRNILFDPIHRNNDDTIIGAKWMRGIRALMNQEKELQRKRARTGTVKVDRRDRRRIEKKVSDL